MSYPQGIDKLMEFVFDRMPKQLPKESFDARRMRGLKDLASVIVDVYGPRCMQSEGGCVCCTAWAVFDCLDRLTDTER